MAEWQCVAYDPEMPGNFQDLCFFETSRRCAGLSECQERMAEEQKRVFRRISELAAHDVPDFAAMEESFDKPTDLLFPPDQDDGPERPGRDDDQ